MNNMSLSEVITYSTLRILCKYSDGTVGSGTGFIMDLCSVKEQNTCIPAVITNNHVVENSIETSFEFCKATNESLPIDTDPFSITITGNAWIHHPDKNIDMCFLPLKTILDEVNATGEKIFYIPLDSDLIADDVFLSSLKALEEVVMVGYPQGLMDSYNHKPIIRRGTTATHPKNNYMGRPEILLDIAAYPGSSGSPVFILNEGSYLSGNTIKIGSRIKLLGVLYAGPQFTATGTISFSNLPTKPTPIIRIPNNLGIIIKANKIFEIESMLKELNQ